jgi:hypothetical protein
MCVAGEGRESSALALCGASFHDASGRDSPWIPVFFKGVKGVGFQVCTDLLHPTSLVLPAWSIAHFFVKKKWVGGAGTIPHPGGSFFLYEKSVLRESDSLRGRRPESLYRLNPQPFPPLKKMGIQGGPAPLGRSSRAEPSRSFPPSRREPQGDSQKATPWASMASATFSKPAMLAPRT